MTCSIRSIDEVPPAVVQRLPSLTKTDFVRFTSGKSSAKLSWFSQWMVARLSSSNPARARVWAAVHSPPTTRPRRASRRSQLTMRLVVADCTSRPPQIIRWSSRRNSPRSMSRLKLTPPAETTVSPPSPASTQV